MARIFIADDDEDYLAAFRIGMESIGHKVFSVNSGAQVMDALRDGHYDIVFLDVVMPGGGAISLVHKIRLEYPDVLIVIMTGHSELYNTPVFTEGFRLATARIKKSASLDEIKAMLSSLLVPK
ncbi:response regulator [Pseudooceanicola nitratireducens]|uniref:response regulator n=1 Tax=Pseudooceanicola nitratireducens TaxID=517719 RepID=UPI001C96E9BE|nr:response regulator [Pseudooceanicola nitratireducens]MBY6158402.1 response regulator [Pseudooceanicola nitratireducens]